MWTHCHCHNVLLKSSAWLTSVWHCRKSVNKIDDKKLSAWLVVQGRSRSSDKKTTMLEKTKALSLNKSLQLFLKITDAVCKCNGGHVTMRPIEHWSRNITIVKFQNRGTRLRCSIGLYSFMPLYTQDKFYRALMYLSYTYIVNRYNRCNGFAKLY